MARDQKVKVRIQAKDEASSEIKKSQISLQKLGNFIKSNLAISIAGATAAMYGFVRALTSVIRASSEQELAVRKLDAALSPLGDKAAAVSKALQAQAAALQQVTQYGDETIIAGQALIASFTKNEEQIKAATKAALDLSAATGQSLQSAFLLLGRAAAGETSMLTRYGIKLDENIPKSEKFAAAVEKINEQFGGQAQAQAKTFTGRLAQLGNAFGDLKEVIGDSITQNKRATESLESIKKVIEDLIPLAKRSGEAFKLLGDIFYNLTIHLRGLYWLSAELANVWLKLKGSTDVVEVSMAALAATSKRTGKSIGDLKEEMKSASSEIKNVDISLKTAGATASDVSDDLDKAAEATKKIGESSDEAAEGIESLDDSTINLKESLKEIEDGLAYTTQAMMNAGNQAVRTASQFDAMAASAGRAAAVSSALAGGASLVQGGTRIRFQGGGSRLVSGSSLFPNLTGGTFTTITQRQPYVRPDGSVVFY